MLCRPFSQQQSIGRWCMKSFQVYGVTQISDSYPNFKYKLTALQRLLGDKYSEYVMLSNRSVAAKGFFSALSSGSLTLIWRSLIGHIKVFFYSIRHRAESVYACYPDIVITVKEGHLKWQRWSSWTRRRTLLITANFLVYRRISFMRLGAYRNFHLHFFTRLPGIR